MNKKEDTQEDILILEILWNEIDFLQQELEVTTDKDDIFNLNTIIKEYEDKAKYLLNLEP